MKKIIYSAIATVLIMSIVACSNTESLFTDAQTPSVSVDTLTYLERVSLLDNYQLSENAVLRSVEKFCKSFLSIHNTKAMDGNFCLKIESKQNISLGKFSRSSENLGCKIDSIPIYCVQMTKDNIVGYALVSGDIRTSRILAFIPKVAVDTTYEQYSVLSLLKKAGIQTCLRQVHSFNVMKDSLVDVVRKKNIIQSRSKRLETDVILEMEEQGWKLNWSNKKMPELSVAWGQGFPYNCKLEQKGCTNKSYDYRCPVGCGVVAIAHALAYYEPRLSVNGQLVDWKMLKKQRQISETANAQLKNQIGFLMKWIGEKVGAQYNCDATLTSVNAIEKFLGLIGMQCDKQNSFNWNSIYNSINNGYIVEANARGIDRMKDKEVGHSWIIDGYMIAKLDVGSYHDQAFYVHNNFGWNGSFDGYYLLEDEGVKFETPQVDLDKALNIHTNIRKR